MLVEKPTIRKSLEKIASALTTDQALHDDLLQEALVHLWRIETIHPGQSTSWYLQSCRFRLQHYLSSGRSLDSRKRRSGQILLPSDPDEYFDFFDRVLTQDECSEDFDLPELVGILAAGLKTRERSVLECLQDGLRLGEICSKLKLSYPTALKYRRRIAARALRLGILRVPMATKTRNGNGNSHGNGNGNGNGHSNGARLQLTAPRKKN